MQQSDLGHQLTNIDILARSGRRSLLCSADIIFCARHGHLGQHTALAADETGQLADCTCVMVGNSLLTRHHSHATDRT